MPDETRRRDRLIALFVGGAVLLNPPLLGLFSGRTAGGWPLLYLYLFAVWAALIAAVALIAERHRADGHRADGHRADGDGGREPEEPP